MCKLFIYCNYSIIFNDFFCVGVMYSGEYDACDVTLSVYPHRVSLKNMPDRGGNRTYDIFQACPVWIYTQSNITSIIFT